MEEGKNHFILTASLEALTVQKYSLSMLRLVSDSRNSSFALLKVCLLHLSGIKGGGAGGLG